jgi:hypothetical protein
MYLFYSFILGIYFMYKKQWSEFEVQALAYGILRKNLYPNFLVRGEYKFDKCRADIAIFRAFKDTDPELVLVVEVKKNPAGTATAQGIRYEELLGVPCVYIRGGDEAYKVLNAVAPYL